MNNRRRGTPPATLLVAALLLICASTARGFSVPSLRRAIALPSVATRAPSTAFAAAPYDAAAASNAERKAELLKRIKVLRDVQERDGDFSIDFGVKGGEIDKKSRAPQKVNFYSISDDAGKAADAVMEQAEELAQNNPTEEPTLYLGDKEKGSKSPLDGEWKLLFTTAADATFSKNSTRGDAKAKNVVDASRGRITNVIDFAVKNGTEPVLLKLNVVIGAKAAGPSRVDLRFRYAKAVLSRFPYRIYIPVPAPFITRLIVFFSRIFRFGKKGKKAVPKAFFDVLYLDDQLRIHKTGEDNLFVQAKDSWNDARPLVS